ncbi:MAG: DUF4351 domain-containing protein [Blastocatellia bacterium]
MKYVTSFERIGIRKGIEIGIEQGSAEIVLRILRNRFWSLDETAETQVRGLSLKRIEALCDALPGLITPADLQMWLLHHTPMPADNGTANGSLELES